MLDSDTKRRIDTARDILVGKLPDPKSQVEQITIALIYKFMDDMDKQSEEMGGKAKFFTGEYSKYSWSKIFDPSISGHELVVLYGEAIQGMNQNPNIPQLFRDIFKNAYLPYRDPETLKSFLKTINEFHYDHSEKLGDAFEYLLSVMSSQGDAGQFRTPRHIIDFIVNVVAPKKDESVLDPACGTAGFLISAYKYIIKTNSSNFKDEKANLVKGGENALKSVINGNGFKGDLLTPDEKKRLIDNFVGYDISPDMVRLSLVNMYLHGFSNPKIYEYDTLTSEEKWNKVFDVIMANPPFMTPKGGIRPHKRFSIQANRSEVLFVDYIHEHLNPNGKAGIIVPEGIIFQTSSAYKALRKMLLDHSLYAVVSLPAGVFNPYSGVKTSILLLDKNLVKKSKKLLFVKINNDGFNLGAQRREIKENDLPIALEIIKKFQKSIRDGKECELNKVEQRYAHIISKDDVNDDYNLSGDRYKEKEVYNGNWDLVELGEVAEISSGNSAPQGDKYFKNGKYPFYRTADVGNVHISLNLSESKDYVNDLAVSEKKLNLFPKNTILFPKSGASTFLNHRVMISREGFVASHLATINAKENILNPRFLFHMLCQIDAKSLTPDQAYPSLKLSDISRIKIPLPPLEVQERIVEEIESYQNIIDGAKKVVESYKPSFKIDKEWDVVEFKEVVNTLTPPNKIQKSDFKNDGKYPILDQSQNEIAGFTDDEKSILRLENPVVIFGDHTCVVKYFEKPFAQGADGIKILNTSENLLPKYFYYYLLSNPIIPHGYNRHFSKLKLIKIPLPPLKIQKEIVAKIEEEQKLVDSNKKLIESFGKKIKDKISEVWGN
jgi:type I restriction enzyme M protein